MADKISNKELKKALSMLEYGALDINNPVMTDTKSFNTLKDYSEKCVGTKQGDIILEFLYRLRTIYKQHQKVDKNGTDE